MIYCSFRQKLCLMIIQCATPFGVGICPEMLNPGSAPAGANALCYHKKTIETKWRSKTIPFTKPSFMASGLFPVLEQELMLLLRVRMVYIWILFTLRAYFRVQWNANSSRWQFTKETLGVIFFLHGKILML